MRSPILFLLTLLSFAAFNGITFSWAHKYQEGNLEAISDAADDDDDGGWIHSEENGIGVDGPCTIARVNGRELTQERFLKDFAYKEPVIIVTEGKEHYNSRFRQRCHKSQMLQEWAEVPVVLASANTYSYSKLETTFGNYLSEYLRPQDANTRGNETFYLFGDIDKEIWKPLLDDYVLPKWSLPAHQPELSFGLAGAGTGVPFHFHGPGFGEVIYGAKRWFLYPYEHRPNWDPDKSTLQWFNETLPNLDANKRPYECLLKSGELIYFPDKWWHATLNAHTSVFISTFLSPFIQMKDKLVGEKKEL